MSENPSTENHKYEDAKQLFKQSGISGLGRFGNIFLRYVQAIIVARMLGASSFGLYVLARNTAQVLSIFGTLGLGPTLTRLIPANVSEGHERTRQITRYSLVGSLLFSLLIAAGLFVFNNWIAVHIFKQPDLAEALIWFSFVIPILSLVQVGYGILRGHKRIAVRVMAENIVFPVSNIIFILVFGLMGMDVRGVVLAYILAYAVTLIYSGYFIEKITSVFGKWRDDEGISKEDRKEVNTLALPLLLSSSLDFVQKWADTFMLGILSTAASVGIYTISLRVGAFIQIPLTAMNMIFAPMIAEISATGNRDRLADNYKLVTRAVLHLSLPIFGLILLLPGELLAMFGKEFSNGNEALVLICLGQLINVSAGSTGQMLVMTGKARLHMYNSMVFLALTLILNWFLIPRYGILGAAVSNMITLGTMNVMRLIQIYQYLKIHPFSLGFWKAIVVALISIGAMKGFESLVHLDFIWLRISVISVLFVVIYLVLTFAAGLDEEEKLLFSKLTKKIRKKLR